MTSRHVTIMGFTVDDGLRVVEKKLLHTYVAETVDIGTRREKREV